MLDHASGIVIGSTAIIGNDVYMLHSTTLGSTGKPMGTARRHPKLGDSCTIGAGCTVLGDITVGDKATIGAAAVVTKDIPPGGTVIGVNNLLKRKEPPQKPMAIAASLRRLNGDQRDRFETWMSNQATRQATEEEFTHPLPYPVEPPSEEGTYDFFGESGALEDLAWIYDRSEAVKVTPAVECPMMERN